MSKKQKQIEDNLATEIESINKAFAKKFTQLDNITDARLAEEVTVEEGFASCVIVDNVSTCILYIMIT